jgi:hypothetical protein
LAKRDLIQEFVAKRKRLGRQRDPLSQVGIRLFGIFLAFESLKRMPAKNREDRDLKQEMIRYFSVGLATCLEGYFRSTIRRLIDHGSPYRENAVKLHDVRIDLGTITRMESAKVTAGEIISHLVPLSSFDDINRHLSTLLGTDYLAAIGPMPLFRKTTFELAHPQAWAKLSSVFQDRHIACHELLPRFPWKFSRVRDQWRAVANVISANESLLKIR